MSSKAVRDAFRAAWPTKMPGLTLYETLNAEPTVSGETFASVAFTSQPALVGLDGLSDEEGQILVGVFTPIGGGDASAITWANTVRTAFRGWSSKDGNGETVVTSITDAESQEAQTENTSYAVLVTLNYTRYNYG